MAGFKLVEEEVELPDGRRVKVRAVRHPGAVAVVPVDDDGKVVLIKQYRPTIGDWLIEIPAGNLEPGESPEECAKRELLEEAGVEAGELRKVMELYLAPGYSDEVLHVFVAKRLSFKEARPTEEELLEVVHVGLEDAVKMVMKGEVRDAKTVASLLHLAFIQGALSYLAALRQ